MEPGSEEELSERDKASVRAKSLPSTPIGGGASLPEGEAAVRVCQGALPGSIRPASRGRERYQRKLMGKATLETVSVDGVAAANPTAVAVTRYAVALTLGTAVTEGQEVTVSYTVPASNAIQDPRRPEGRGPHRPHRDQHRLPGPAQQRAAVFQ